jgi:hypothetical protein
VVEWLLAAVYISFFFISFCISCCVWSSAFWCLPCPLLSCCFYLPASCCPGMFATSVSCCVWSSVFRCLPCPLVSCYFHLPASCCPGLFALASPVVCGRLRFDSFFVHWHPDVFACLCQSLLLCAVVCVPIPSLSVGILPLLFACVMLSQSVHFSDSCCVWSSAFRYLPSTLVSCCFRLPASCCPDMFASASPAVYGRLRSDSSLVCLNLAAFTSLRPTLPTCSH